MARNLILPVFSYLPPTDLSFFQRREGRGGEKEGRKKGGTERLEKGDRVGRREIKRDRDRHRQRKREPRQRKRCTALEKATQHSFHVL